MLDFTSALYLGLEHASWELEPWSALTQGRPAALSEAREARGLAAGLADLMGCESGVLMPSTLHLFWDLFGVLARQSVGVLLDDAAYPIMRWGLQRVVATGAPVRLFSHRDPSSLARQTKALLASGRRPVIVTDGVCLSCGRVAPLRRYLHLLERHDGWLVVDDTQALGLLGAGGGGSLCWSGQRSPRALIGASLAKAFGAPLAVLTGSAERIRELVTQSETRVHSSPPCAAVIRAGQRALELNASVGDELRRRLSELLARFRHRLRQMGLKVLDHPLPVQTLQLPANLPSSAFYRALLARGIQSVLHKSPHDGTAGVSFIITAAHSAADIDHASSVVAELLREFGIVRSMREWPPSLSEIRGT